MKKEYTIQNLHCANCAAKIEASLQKDYRYKDVVLDFARKSLYLESENDVDHGELEATIGKIEYGVKLVDLSRSDNVDLQKHSCTENGQHFHDHENCHNHEHTHNHTHNDDHSHSANSYILVRLAISLILFIAGLFLKDNSINLLIFIASYIIISYDVLFKSAKNITRGQIFDENFLMSIATLGAFVIGDYPEGVAVMIFYQIGEYFQSKAVDHSRKSIEEKMDLRVERVVVLAGDKKVIKMPKDVAIGDVMVLSPGEKLALDGVVKQGTSHMQTASITGESLPRVVSKGDAVLSGFINGQAELLVTASDSFENSTVSKILDLVKKASAKRAKIEKFITRFARYYTPAVVLLAFIIAVIPPLVLSEPFYGWVYRGLVFLVISCPCALVLSIPLGFFAGLGASAKNGVIVKSGSDLEKLSKLERVVFDKTGTLTEGSFSITNIQPAADLSRETLIREAVLCESHSNHPIAKSIVKQLNTKIESVHVSSFEDIPGHGIILRTETETYLAGNREHLLNNNVRVPNLQGAQTVVYIAKNAEYRGCISLQDRIKPNVVQSLQALKKLGVKSFALLSGDKQDAVLSVANALGIEKAYGALLPQDKLQMVEKIKEESKTQTVAFVGDGTNDAPVLISADIGIAMGGVGTDAALEAADMMIMEDNIGDLPRALKVAKKTMRIIRQNIVLVLGFKLIVLILGIFGYASMWLAIFADVGVALLAVLNTLRILKTKSK